MTQGFVYILVSPNSSYVKIGGTERPISERLRDINGTLPYAEHGPWDLSDFLYVTDWRLVEGEMHRHFQASAVRDVAGTRELFSIAPHEARIRLAMTNPTLRIDHERTQQIFSNRDVKLYLFRLFELSGLFGNVDIQGSWTLTLLPKTNGGRWFTLNIGSHEVAFSTKASTEDQVQHYIVLDRLILEYPDTIIWIGKHGGAVAVAEYVAAERAVLINFMGGFSSAERFFSLPGVRRALIAYWAEALADLRERKAKSVYARFHSYDSVSTLMEYKRAADSVFREAAGSPMRRAGEGAPRHRF